MDVSQQQMTRKGRAQLPKRGDSQQSLDQVFSALSDGTRRNILERLVRAELSVNEIAAPYRVSLPAVSKHLAVLERAELITRKRVGRTSSFTVNTATLAEGAGWIARNGAMWNQSLENLAAYLDDIKSREGKRIVRRR